MNPNFETRKIERLLATNGKEYTFKRRKKNNYGEYVNNEFDETKIVCVFHEITSHVTESATEASVMQSTMLKMLRPALLTTYKRYLENMIVKDDLVNINGQDYKVTGITNIQEGNFGIDISLDVIK